MGELRFPGMQSAPQESAARHECTIIGYSGVNEGFALDVSTEAAQRDCTRNDRLLDPALLVGTIHPVLPFRLSFAIHRNVEDTRSCIRDSSNLYYFSSKHHETETGANPSLASLFKFCQEVQNRLENPQNLRRHLIYYCYPNERHISNSVLLLASYLVLVAKWDPKRAAQRFSALGLLVSTEGILLLNHLDAIHRARMSGFLEMDGVNRIKFDALHAQHAH